MIVRAKKKSNYTILPNEFLLDETISDKARGTLARLLSRPDNWNLNINHLVKTGKAGHTAVRSAIKELEAAGYILRDVSRHENGRIIGVKYIIHESPVKAGGSCGVRPEPDQPEQSGRKTAPMDIQGELFGKKNMATQANNDILPEAGETLGDATDIEETHMQKTGIKETAPVINTDIKQILRETTTTTPEPVRSPEHVVCDSAVPVPSSSSNLDILNLIPEQHRNPIVFSLVNKAIMDYPARAVEEAVAYAARNVRGGSMQFKAYLDKTLKNKWAEGFLESMREQNGPCQHETPWASSCATPRGRFPNGTVTGNKAMDTNCMVAAQFLLEMGVDVDRMCAEA
nr:hypothetical protein [uncultured Desulfobacter sp.]